MIGVAPVVKWAGGKGQLLFELEKYLPQDYSTYFEPFLGGGAMLFYLQPQCGVVGDINQELINLYRVIRDSVDELIEDLKKHQNQADYFYQLRELDRDPGAFGALTPIQRASRTLYLNKTCYNGLYRVNSKGYFNTPFGNYKNPNIVPQRRLRAVSTYFQRAELTFLACDFQEVLATATEGDFVYLDPPYDPVSVTSNFTSYGKDGFGRPEQERLKEVCDSLNSRGAKFILSNSATDFILDLYADYRIETVEAMRSINSKGVGRGPVAEVLVRNYSN